MHAHLEDIYRKLDDSRRQLTRAVESIPEHLRSRQPGPDRWSVNEILEHLSLVERRFAAIIALRIGEAREKGLGPEQDSRDAFPQALQEMLKDRARRRVAPDPVQPRTGLTSADALCAVEEARALTRSALAAGDGLALSKVVHQHPVFGTLNIYQLAEFIAGHEIRHSQQIAGVGQTLQSDRT